MASWLSSPVTALTALKLGGTISSSLLTASAYKAQAGYQASLYNRNARLELFKAKDAIRRGDKEAQEKLKNVRAVRGRQRASFAAQGIEVDSGSALEVQQDTAVQGALDALTIRNNAWREAWGYRVNASGYDSSARFAKLSGKYNARNTLITGGFQAAQDIMGGYAQYKGY